MRPDREALDAAAEALWGRSYGTQWKDTDEQLKRMVRDQFVAGLDAYLSKMPRVWAVKTERGFHLDAIFSLDVFAIKAAPLLGGTAAPVAIVELKEGE